MVGVRTWRTVNPRDLTSDPGRHSFSWPTPAEERELRSSLDRHGMLRPLLGMGGIGGGLEVVSGARRLAWAVETGLEEVPVAVLDACTPAGLWDRMLADARDHRPLNPVEVGLYLRRRTASTGEALEDLEAGALPALGLAPRALAAEDALWVSGLPPKVTMAAPKALSSDWLGLPVPLRRVTRPSVAWARA